MNQLIQDKVVNFSRHEKTNVVFIESPTLVISHSEYLVIENASDSWAVSDEQMAVIVEPGEYQLNQALDSEYAMYPIEGDAYTFDGNFVINLEDSIKAACLLGVEIPVFAIGKQLITIRPDDIRSESFRLEKTLFTLDNVEVRSCSMDTQEPATEVYDAIVIGAGPYGTSAAVACQSNKLSCYWVGEPLSFWLRHIQPTHLRSVKAATNIYTGKSGYSFIDFCNRYDISHSGKIRFWQFLAYYFYLLDTFEIFPQPEKVVQVDQKNGHWVVRLEGPFGEKTVTARNVINATGIGMHPNKPPFMENMPARLASHVSEHAVHAFPESQTIAVIGGAQSALEYALEADLRGNHVTLYVRDSLIYRNLHEPSQIVYRFLANNCEKIIPYLPVGLRTRLLGYLLEGTCDPQVAEDIASSHINVKEHVEIQEIYRVNDDKLVLVSEDGERQFDRVIAATGYHYDIHNIAYLSDYIRDAKHVVAGRFPNVDQNLMLKSAARGMYFTGYACIYAVGFKAQFINGSNLIVKRIIDDMRRHS